MIAVTTFMTDEFKGQSILAGSVASNGILWSLVLVATVKKHYLESTGLAQLATKGVLGEVVTTCERSRVSAWGFSFKVGIYGVLPHRCVDSRLAGTTYW
ncbi:hypothetical protein Tco_1177079, partial [Tanacetum coccineum]